MDYNALHAARAAGLLDLGGKRVLTVGCGTGRDSSYFLKYNPGAVHGVDVLRTVGKDFVDERAHYAVASVTELPMRDESYDLTYCFATLEHVTGIKAAFREIVRVTRPGGVIYCLSAPLWHANKGHHMAVFFDHPWVHLFHDKAGVLRFAEERGITHESVPMPALVDYMFSDRHFNKEHGRRYVEACDALKDVSVIRNDLEFDPVTDQNRDALERLVAMGYDRDGLLGSVHTFIARKL